jgi:hypothetical protein
LELRKVSSSGFFGCWIDFWQLFMMLGNEWSQTATVEGTEWIPADLANRANMESLESSAVGESNSRTSPCKA